MVLCSPNILPVLGGDSSASTYVHAVNENFDPGTESDPAGSPDETRG